MSPPSGTDSLSLFHEPSPPDGAGKTTAPHFEIEKRLHRHGLCHVAGVDEAGRGPLAGPVVAAAVILAADSIPAGLNDSKKLTAKRRALLFDDILRSAIAVSWHAASARRIDQINILQASLEAMSLSVAALPVTAHAALFDGRDVPLPWAGIGQSVIKGDATSLSIAAASIVAKVIRDRIMIRADAIHPVYGFAGHKGYGSAGHMTAIREHGPCPLHRRSFSPVKDMI